jgi:hypothetical protein
MRRTIALTVSMFALLAGTAQAATTLHVDGATGNDTVSCGSATAPCKTINYAIALGETLTAPITLDVSAGSYAESLSLSDKDSGLTITGAGNGTDPATDTIIAPSTGLGIGTTNSTTAASLTLNHLSIDVSAADGDPAIAGNGTDLTMTDVGIEVQGTTAAIATQGPITATGGSIATASAGAGPAITIGPNAVQLTGTPVSETGTNPAIVAAPITLTNSPITTTSTTSTAPAIATAAGPTAVTVTDSAIDVKGNGLGIAAEGPLTVTGSPVTLEGTTGNAPAIEDSGTGPAALVSVSGAPITVDGKGLAVDVGNANLSDVQITQNNPAATAPTVDLAGGPSTLSRVSITSDTTAAPLLVAPGSTTVSDSTITSMAATGAAPSVVLGGVTPTPDISLERTKVSQADAAIPILAINNADVALDSSEVLGGLDTTFDADSGTSDTLTVASSTIDAGALGVRGSGPSVLAHADNADGSTAVVNVEGSILVEPPQADVAGSNGRATINCSYTEVPTTTQVASASQGAINCGDTNGNTYTSSVSAIFQVNYAPNPSWNGVDSVPASAISLPAPFTDSSTDVLGNPRVVNGEGTCTAAIRDRGAIELQGHSGVVPAPTISGPASTFTGARHAYSVKAPNVPSSVPLSYRWTSSDHGSAGGASFSHKFTRSGRFTVSVTVTGAADCVGHASKTVTVVGTDAITHLAVSPKKLKTKATISYRASAAATTTLTIELKTMKGYKVVKRLTHHDKAGKVKITLRRGKLKAGRYRVVAQSKNGAGKGKRVSVTFTVKK